jgi:hypothetical protein
MSVASEEAKPPTPRKWQFQSFPNVNAALTFANNHHLHPGALSVTVESDQKVGMFYYG